LCYTRLPVQPPIAPGVGALEQASQGCGRSEPGFGAVHFLILYLNDESYEETFYFFFKMSGSATDDFHVRIVVDIYFSRGEPRSGRGRASPASPTLSLDGMPRAPPALPSSPCVVPTLSVDCTFGGHGEIQNIVK
jgi:hypothetical protein